ncbi:MAG: hypothetical protein J6U01_01190 [Clostridia bacterium]|nr:hypothetical protein [Clostridia bacterium]
MKKTVSILMALVMILGIGCAMAENSSALPAWTYNAPQEDPVLKAVVGYMLTMDSGVTVEEGGVLIPTPIIVKTEMNKEETEATVWGNFWLFSYARNAENGKILDEKSASECPGIMKLEKKEDGWTVVSFEAAGDGEAYYEDLKKFANGDEKLLEEYMNTTGASENSYLPQYQRAAVVEYVAANHLDIEAYQEFGWDPVSVID